MVIHNFQEAHALLRPLYDNSHTIYTLDNIWRLMDVLGNPQDKFKAIHVAGTSGKTSTAYYIAALLGATGTKVGLTVSPHIDEVNERIQLNLVPLAEADFCRQLTKFWKIIATSAVKPSYFEFMVAFAYWEFAEQKVDYAVIEVGLGGLLDCTNVIRREDKVCVITDIGLDHTEILGGTLAEIAAQKAGIIQPGNHVFMHAQAAEIMDEVKKVCAAKNAPLHLVSTKQEVKQAQLPLFQRRNLDLARQMANYVLERENRPSLTEEQVMQAAAVYIPARMEQLKLGGKTLIIDGSHNYQKLAALRQSIGALYPGQKIAALVAFVEGNDARWQGGIKEVMKLAEKIIVTSYESDQDTPKKSVAPAQIADYCKAAGFDDVTAIENPAEAFKELQQCPEPVLLVAGSFYLLNSIRPLIV
ncbi:MAG TPA: Mur ligase family protein [Candidatus Saccharimonadales bacterium]|nr:Mur ligase family protein [Candidatus Saccharimonadales bacterium]